VLPNIVSLTIEALKNKNSELFVVMKKLILFTIIMLTLVFLLGYLLTIWVFVPVA